MNPVLDARADRPCSATAGGVSNASGAGALTWWLLAGLSLLAFSISLPYLSRFFNYGEDRSLAAYVVFVAVFIAAATVHLLILTRIRYSPSNAWLIAWIVGLGFLFRGIQLFSTPIMEDDFYRYLWDGGLVANGLNPYTSAPSEIAASFENAHDRMGALAVASGDVIQRINHPELTTCYPPVAVGLFALSHYIHPWSLNAWRFVLLAFDSVTLILLFGVLRQIGCAPLWVAAYWWSPLVIKEGFNSVHMDIAVLPFVVAALWLSMRPVSVWRATAASALLAAAVGIKIWPIILAPLVFRPLLRSPRVLITGLMTFAAGFTAVMAAFHTAIESGPSSGILAYSEQWEMNDALFMAILWAARQFPALQDYSDIVARGIAALVLASVAAVLSLRNHSGSLGRWRAALWIIAAAFMLSPTQFPWYFLWAAPLLVLVPSPALLLMTALLPLYYLRFPLRAAGNVHLFDYGIVWLEYVPVWVLLAFEGWRAIRPTKPGIPSEATCETAVQSA